MSFHWKRKTRVDTDGRATLCRRCHVRVGTTQMQNVALTPAQLTPIVMRDLWFCDRCLDEIGRCKPRNS